MCSTGMSSSSHERITITIDGQQVIGEITHRCHTDISLKIIVPFCNLSTGRHIPYFSAPFANFLTEYGEKTAQELLDKLYNLGKFIEENQEQLKIGLTEFRKSLDTIKKPEFFEREEFIRKRQELRKRLRNNEIDNKEHEKELSKIRKENKNYKCRRQEFLILFYEKNFPMVVSIDQEEQILDLLEGRLSLKTLSSDE